MRNLKHICKVLSVLALSIAINGCYYDNEEDLYLGSSTCDLTNITYSKSIAPIFAANCNSCHSGKSPSGAILTDNYTSVKTYITRIKGSINHQSGFIAMPQNGSKLSVCDLAKVDVWITQGMLNN